MITEKIITEAKNALIEQWGEAGEKVIAECGKCEPLNMTSKEFFDECTACGGNWGGMLLTGIKKLRPTVWEAIPDDMGDLAFGCLCSTLVLCGVDTSQ